MKISLEWLGDYVELPADLKPSRLAHDLTMSTVEVEQVIDLAAELESVVVAQVLSVEKHPDADRLGVVRLDDGSGERTVVCGGSNVVEGMKVALALPGAQIGDITIREATVRGVASAGMICSGGELGLNDLLPCQGKEICDLSALEHPPGTPLAAAIGYDDIVLEIDNKSLTNRPDLWGHYGVARELAALYELELAQLPAFQSPDADGGLEVRITDTQRCRRYTATRITGISAQQAPLWLRSRLSRVGQRPINLPVDLTNFVMMAVGQPSHAFDVRDLPKRVEVRRATPDEPLVLLDGTSLTLDPETLVIASHDEAVALGGVMGGELAVRDDTDELWLEIANFEPVEIRRAARRYGLRTESSTRFEKGIDPDRVLQALGLFMDLCARTAPGSSAVAHVDSFPAPLPPVTIEVDVDFLQRRLGRPLPVAQMRSLLNRLGFEAQGEARLVVRVPSWRATGDVSLPEDIVEEVARLYGYEALGFSPPIVALEAPVIQPQRRMERRLREYLAFRASMRECVSYPWVSAKLLDAAGMADVPTLGLAHPPSPDQRLAPSLVPQLLGMVAGNLRYTERFRLFEQGRVFRTTMVPTPGSAEKLPEQPRMVAGAFVGEDAGALFYEAKAVLEGLGRSVQVAPLGFAKEPNCGWSDPAAQLSITAGGHPIGTLAVVSARARRKAGIKRAEVVLFELQVDALRPFTSRENRAVPLPEYPQVDFDISVVLERRIEWEQVHAFAAQADPLVRGVSFVDEYTGAQVPEGHKSLTLRLHLGSDEKTLVRAEIDEAAGKVVAGLAQRFGGQIRD